MAPVTHAVPTYRGPGMRRRLAARYGTPNAAPLSLDLRDLFTTERVLFVDDDRDGAPVAYWEPYEPRARRSPRILVWIYTGHGLEPRHVRPEHAAWLIAPAWCGARAALAIDAGDEARAVSYARMAAHAALTGAAHRRAIRRVRPG